MQNRLYIKHPPEISSKAPFKTSYQKIVSNQRKKKRLDQIQDMRYHTIIVPMLSSIESTRTALDIQEKYGICIQTTYTYLKNFKRHGKPGLTRLDFESSEKIGRKNEWQGFNWELIRELKNTGLLFREINNHPKVVAELKKQKVANLSKTTYYRYI